jgi:hypothetical protein
MEQSVYIPQNVVVPLPESLGHVAAVYNRDAVVIADCKF